LVLSHTRSMRKRALAGAPMGLLAAGAVAVALLLPATPCFAFTGAPLVGQHLRQRHRSRAGAGRHNSVVLQAKKRRSKAPHIDDDFMFFDDEEEAAEAAQVALARAADRRQSKAAAASLALAESSPQAAAAAASADVGAVYGEQLLPENLEWDENDWEDPVDNPAEVR
jgi:hypothetical protein